MKQQLINWWSGLQQREQRLLIITLGVLGVAAVYWWLFQPLRQAINTQQQTALQLQQQLTQLQRAAPMLRQNKDSNIRSGGSLSQIVSNSARDFSIRVTRMQPQNDQLQLVLDDVSFEQLLKWLYQLQYQHGVILVNLDLSKTDNPGIVRVRRMVIE